jgi:hypothetical protein
MRPRDDVATGSEGVGRFLRGTITERFLPHWRDGDIPGAGIALSGVPITVIGLTETVRRITDTAPGTGRLTDVGAAFVEYTTTIPGITVTITDVIP